MSRDIDYTFKILMLGSASTGKSSLSDRYVHGIFSEDIKLTVGVEFFVKTIHYKDKFVKLQIWDLGGESRFRFLLPTYCLGSSGAIFLFDLTRPETLHELDSWIGIVREKNSQIPIFLVGNKKDLTDIRKVPEDHGIQTAIQNNLTEYIETSAKSGENVEFIFQSLTEHMLKRIERLKLH